MPKSSINTSLEVPGSTKEILRILMKNFGYSRKSLVKIVGISLATLELIRRGKKISAEDDFKLLCFYLQLQLYPEQELVQGYQTYKKRKYFSLHTYTQLKKFRTTTGGTRKKIYELT